MIIAEIGLNHLGMSNWAKEYVHGLMKTDVDAVTLQIREPEFYSKMWNGYDLKLNEEVYLTIKKEVHEAGKKFGIAIGDIGFIDFFEAMGTDFYKFIRNDITNFPLIDKLQNTGKTIIVSTGLSSEEDISNFVNHVGNDKNFRLNHTQLSYNVEDCNLSAIKHMREKHGLDVSFGSHCENHNVIYMALAFHPSDILYKVIGKTLLILLGLRLFDPLIDLM